MTTLFGPANRATFFIKSSIFLLAGKSNSAHTRCRVSLARAHRVSPTYSLNHPKTKNLVCIEAASMNRPAPGDMPASTCDEPVMPLACERFSSRKGYAVSRSRVSELRVDSISDNLHLDNVSGHYQYFYARRSH